MRKSIVVSEQDNIAALLEGDRVLEFFVNRGELLLGDIYTASVENILPGIDAAFVNLGKDKMGFLHANDVPGQGLLKERLAPKQKLLVQITKEPTGHKGPRVSTAISLPGRFLVLVPEERGVSISRRIAEARERARLKSIVNLLKPPGVGLIIRTEAKGQGEQELFEDFEQLWDRWQSIVSDGEASIGPALIYRDQDLLYRVIRDAYSTDINEIVVDSSDGQKRALDFLSGWTGRGTQVSVHSGEEPLLVAKGVDHEIEAALCDRVDLPSGGHLNIQPTEALTVIDVNSGRFTSSRTQAETVRRTNLEAAHEIPRQLRLRNVGGMVIVDFIDMESRKDQQLVLEAFQRALEDDRAKPQVGQLSDLGLVELTRRRQGQSLRELFTTGCNNCSGLGVVPTLEIGYAEHRRLISTKPKEDELSGRRAASRRIAARQGSALRAASVSSGRVRSTVAEAAAAAPEEEVSEEILEQVPDELLDTRPGGYFAGAGAAGHHEPADAAEDASVDVEDTALLAHTFKPTRPLFEEGTAEDEAELSQSLGTAIAEAEKLAAELDFACRRDQAADRAAEQETEEQAAPAPPEPYSPFEVEPEPSTGVYRLKPKPGESGKEDELESHDQPAGDSNQNLSARDSLRLDSKSSQAAGNSGSEIPAATRQPFDEMFYRGSEPGSWFQQSSQQLELPFGSSPKKESDVPQVTAGSPASGQSPYKEGKSRGDEE